MSAYRSIREWGHLPIGQEGVAEAAARSLERLSDRASRQLRVSRPVLTRTTRPSLQAGQVVGILDVPGASIEILPKIDGSNHDVRKALVHMLAVAHGLPVADNELTPLSTQNESLLEVLIALFADRLLAAARRGLPHRYRPMQDDLPFLRGRLDIRRQISRHVLRADLLACEFDELSVDTPLNRVLKSAVARLRSVSRNAANVRKLSELAARFEFVSASRDPLREPVQRDRTNTAFHRLYLWARLLLAGEWQSTTSGVKEGVALLFAMNDLFETFVGRCLKAALATGSVRLQASGRHALTDDRGSPLFALRPDMIVDGDVVIDTKWKELGPDDPVAGVDRSDVYQMLAYGRAWNARRLVLLYPWHEGLPDPGICRRWHVAGTEVPFDIATVNVGDPRAVPAALRDLIEDNASFTVSQPRWLPWAA